MNRCCGGVSAATAHVWQNGKVYEHHKVKVKLKQQTTWRDALEQPNHGEVELNGLWRVAAAATGSKGDCGRERWHERVGKKREVGAELYCDRNWARMDRRR
jgi:hypothetical protein